MIIGVYFKSPLMIIPIAILSHFVLDAIPHWDGNFDRKKFRKTGKIIISDMDMIVKLLDIVASVLIITFFYMQSDRNLMVLGAIMAILPDISKIGYLTRLKDTKGYMRYIMFHTDIQRETSMRNGLSIQAICCIMSVILLIRMI